MNFFSSKFLRVYQMYYYCYFSSFHFSRKTSKSTIAQSSPPCRCRLGPPFLNEFLDSFHLVVFDVDLIPAFAAPGVCPVIHGIFLNGVEFPGHHGLMHEHLVPYHSVPLVIPGRKTILENNIDRQMIISKTFFRERQSQWATQIERKTKSIHCTHHKQI